MSAPVATKVAGTKRVFRLKPRERRLMLIASVLIGCWLLVSWLVQPLWDRTNELRGQVELQTEKLNALQKLLTQMPEIELDYQQIAGYLSVEDGERAQSALFHELESLSRTSNLHLNLKPRPTKAEDTLIRYEVEVDVEGQQSQLLSFLDGLLKMPKLIAIERLRISSVPAKANLLRANLVVQHLVLSRSP